MTNAQIVFAQRCKLLDAGAIKGTGEFVKVETNEGTKEMELPEEIHTFQGWKSRGFSVMKGQKAVARFAVWKHTSKEKEDGEVKESMFLQMAAWFSASQVQAI